MAEDTVQKFMIGDVEVLRVVEWQGPLAPARRLVPDSRPELWREHEDQLAPGHWQPAEDLAVAALQTWVVRSGGRTVLVDTGVGRDRERPANPRFHRRDGDLPGRLRRAGVDPADVDLVVNTHIHADHVGWNTRDAGGTWVPTFPNARYLLPAADDHHFGPEGGYGGGVRVDDRLLYEDSVAPVHRAGQARVWEGEHRIDEHLVLAPAPGHTPGSSVLRVASRGERAVFVGDLLHSPVQILRPECSSCFCLDPRQAAATRRRELERAAADRALVVPAHFAGAGAVEVRKARDGFTLHRWAA
ncbi:MULTISPECIES: MBL fold metallo-hydrolase [Streptomyces]|uniref:MBL fold metallo-hydrolase n=1 Tax=Streptomyces albidocamelliae TaxID=2981135 RepID=A0ABY6ESK0_9ACTN|nr:MULTISPECIES: MBL fold metallo-hydrolase [unclassified Streptomyces]OKJ86518.1 beta-lactamase [Streptomyces sp. CB01883]UXY37366.1 MBL fold metallo-hydrolase [Streptomyces sp. HUAS 14-6]